MKKLLFLLLMATAFIATETKAQTKMTGTNDTSLAAGTTYYYTKVLGDYSAIGFSGIYEKVSGTVSGYAWMEGTIDGTNYFIISDSLTIANSSGKQKKRVNITKENYALLKARWAVANVSGIFTVKDWYLKL